MSDLESKTELFDYNISDLFVLLKATRPLPQILSYEDPVIRYYELFINGIITVAQIGMYYSLYQILSS